MLDKRIDYPVLWDEHTAYKSPPHLSSVQLRFCANHTLPNLESVVLGPVDGADILVAAAVGGVLVAGEGSGGQVVELGALGEKAQGGTAIRDVALNLAVRGDGSLGLLDDDKLLAAVVGEGLPAGDKGIGVQLRDGVGEAGDANVVVAGAGVEVEGGEGLGSVVLDEGEGLGERRGATVGDDVGLAVADVVGGAVDVEGASAADVVNVADVVQGRADVDGVDKGAVDGRIEVLAEVGDVEDQVEGLAVGGLRVVGAGGGASGSGGGQASEAESSDGSNHCDCGGGSCKGGVRRLLC